MLNRVRKKERRDRKGERGEEERREMKRTLAIVLPSLPPFEASWSCSSRKVLSHTHYRATKETSHQNHHSTMAVSPDEHHDISTLNQNNQGEGRREKGEGRREKRGRRRKSLMSKQRTRKRELEKVQNFSLLSLSLSLFSLMCGGGTRGDRGTHHDNQFCPYRRRRRRRRREEEEEGGGGGVEGENKRNHPC